MLIMSVALLSSEPQNCISVQIYRRGDDANTIAFENNVRLSLADYIDRPSANCKIVTLLIDGNLIYDSRTNKSNFSVSLYSGQLFEGLPVYTIHGICRIDCHCIMQPGFFLYPVLLDR